MYIVEITRKQKTKAIKERKELLASQHMFL